MYFIPWIFLNVQKILINYKTQQIIPINLLFCKKKSFHPIDISQTNDQYWLKFFSVRSSLFVHINSWLRQTYSTSPLSKLMSYTPTRYCCAIRLFLTVCINTDLMRGAWGAYWRLDFCRTCIRARRCGRRWRRPRLY